MPANGQTQICFVSFGSGPLSPPTELSPTARLDAAPIQGARHGQVSYEAIGSSRLDCGSMQRRAIGRPNDAAAQHGAHVGDDRQSRTAAAIGAFKTRDEKAAPGGLRKAARSAAAEPFPLHAQVPEGITRDLVNVSQFTLRRAQTILTCPLR